MKILVAEPLAPAGVELLRAQSGWELVLADPKTYEKDLADCDALLVRSAVKVTKQVLEKAPRLKVIGRAGVGVDNVDLEAATSAGVLVMNTPGGNAVSVAEHTLAVMLAMARSVPQASESTRAGKWEKKKFLGSELRGKTLGIVGLGSIGREVVRRAKTFEMKIVAHDPYVSSQTAADLGVALLPLNELFAQADYITLHVALTPETDGMLNAAAFAQMKPGVRIVNCARGELIDEVALEQALRSGHVAGAALDVFRTEPPGENALFQIPSVVATPHIAGSTEEAQEIVGVRIVEQVVEYLTSGVALNAVNMPALTAEQFRALGPWADLADKLGCFASHIANGNPHTIRLTYFGKIGENNTQLLRNAALAGVLSRSVAQKANVVNAMQIATSRGFAIAERREARDSYADAIRVEIETDLGVFAAEGSVVLNRPRLTQVEGIACEATLGGNLMYSRNDDVPGVIGFLGTVLGRNSVNIASFALGRQNAPLQPGEPLTAISIVETDGEVPDSVIQQLFENKAVRFVRRVTFR
jgi:D-3-phosphoglycerate dehydrogenase / 2-oxoglutarate reductase